ncbi:MAG: DUF4394 domain-containing protein [Chitinophagaceae bacterium]
MTKLSTLCLLLAGSVCFTSCDKDDNDMQNASGPDIMVYGLTESNELVAFNAQSPSIFSSRKAITGIGSGEKLMSIDFRPATGELYVLSNASKLYVLNTSTAAVRAVGSAFTPALSGTVASIDFNPTVDRIRLVSNNGQNLRLHPETGATAGTDQPINGGGTPSIGGIAYTNSKSGASSTTLYDLDASSGKLFKQEPPNNGVLVEVGSLGFTFSGQAAFDISPDNSVALVAVKSGSSNPLYTLDLNTGKTTGIGNLSQSLLDIAIPTDPVAYAVDATNKLHIFNPASPTVVTKSIEGLQPGETIHGIDFRPATGQLFALGSTSRLYVLNLGTADAVQVGAIPFIPALSGNDFGFDFNPTVDRIRVVSNTGQNLRLNPDNGLVAGTDGALNPGTPAVSAAAYTNNFAGSTATRLFVIDHTTDKLYEQNPPNNGVLVEIGALGVDITSANGFDIGGTSNKAWVLATAGGTTRIYTLNTSTGALAEPVNFPVAVKGFAVGLGF